MSRIDIRGTICSNDIQWIYEMFDIESTSPKNVLDSLKEADGESVDVVINSGGGDVHSGSEMYYELKNYKGNTEVHIVGLAASAASVAAMGGNTVKAVPTSQIMIHNAKTGQLGDYRDMDQASEMLKVVNKSASNAYRIKTGMAEDELLELMDNETWMDPHTAMEKGFVDEVMFDDSTKAVASTSIGNMIPQQVIDGIRNGALKSKQQPNGIDKQTLDNALSVMKQDILNELKQNNEPTQPVNNWLF